MFHSLFNFSLQVCDSDTMLDPAATVEMLKVLEVDHKVGGVGGDVKVRMASLFAWVTFRSKNDPLNIHLLHTKLCARYWFWSWRHIRICFGHTLLCLLLSKLK